MDRVKARQLLEQAVNPSTAPTALEELRDLIESDTASIESLTADNANKSEQIRQLQADNVKLFLKSGQQGLAQEQEPKKNAYDVFEETILNAMKGVTDNGD